MCEAVRAAHDSGARQLSFTFFIGNLESEVKDWDYLEGHNPFTLVESFVSRIDRLTP